MAEPVRKQRSPELLDEEPGITLERWVEGPGGRMELVEMPLTPELFLNPQVGDHMTQGSRRVLMFEHPSGRPLPTRRELQAEVARLRAEIDRLRKADSPH